MQDLTPQILELVRLASTDLPPDVEAALRQAAEQEHPGSAATIFSIFPALGHYFPHDGKPCLFKCANFKIC